MSERYTTRTVLHVDPGKQVGRDLVDGSVEIFQREHAVLERLDLAADGRPVGRQDGGVESRRILRRRVGLDHPHARRLLERHGHFRVEALRLVDDARDEIERMVLPRGLPPASG
jgi:hypothetical protein